MTTDTIGGVFTYTVALIRGLQDTAEVVVATMGPPLRESQRAALRSAGAVAVHDGGYALEWMAEPWDEVQAAGRWLLDLDARERPDVVHLNGYAHAVLPWSTPCVVVAHSCVLSWWRAVHCAPVPPAWERYRAAVRDGLRAADAGVAPTGHMLSELRELYGEWNGLSAVIHNGTPGSRSPQPPVKEELILAAGRMWDEGKNLTELDRAAGGLAWPVLAAGSVRAPSGDPVRPRNVRVLGELETRELATVRRRAAVFAAPALYEPFGLAILEAAGDSCALVLGDIPSLRELWDGVARFVDPRDHRRLHAVLRELISDRAQRERLGRRAARRAQRYGIPAMTASYRELYASLPAGVGSVR